MNICADVALLPEFGRRTTPLIVTFDAEQKQLEGKINLTLEKNIYLRCQRDLKG